MNRYNNTVRPPNAYSYDVPLQKTEKPQHTGLRKVATFLYETPVSIIALAVQGIALVLIFPRIAPPFLGLTGSTLLTRAVVLIIDSTDYKRLMKMKETAYSFYEQHPQMQYIAFLIAVLACAVSPFSGFVISAGLGIYKGIIVEIDIYKYKRELRREELKKPVPEARIHILYC